MFCKGVPPGARPRPPRPAAPALCAPCCAAPLRATHACRPSKHADCRGLQLAEQIGLAEQRPAARICNPSLCCNPFYAATCSSFWKRRRRRDGIWPACAERAVGADGRARAAQARAGCSSACRRAWGSRTLATRAAPRWRRAGRPCSRTTAWTLAWPRPASPTSTACALQRRRATSLQGHASSASWACESPPAGPGRGLPRHSWQRTCSGVVTRVLLTRCRARAPLMYRSLGSMPRLTRARA